MTHLIHPYTWDWNAQMTPAYAEGTGRTSGVFPIFPYGQCWPARRPGQNAEYEPASGRGTSISDIDANRPTITGHRASPSCLPDTPVFCGGTVGFSLDGDLGCADVDCKGAPGFTSAATQLLQWVVEVQLLTCVPELSHFRTTHLSQV